MIDVATFGEAMASLRSAGPLTVPGTLTARIAGAESTVAIGLARLGHEVRWVSRVGDDTYGSVLLRTLRGERVDVSGVEVDPARPTGLMIAAARTADTTAVTYYRAGSAASAISRADVARLGPARILHVSGITPALSASAAEALRVAVGSGGYSLVSLDVNFRSRLWSREQAAATLRPLLPHLSLVIGSEDELPLLASGGAGDAFTAGYLSGVLEDLSPVERLVRGTKVAAFCVSTAGDYEGLPTRAELDGLQPSEVVTLR